MSSIVEQLGKEADQIIADDKEKRRALSERIRQQRTELDYNEAKKDLLSFPKGTTMYNRTLERINKLAGELGINYTEPNGVRPH